MTTYAGRLTPAGIAKQTAFVNGGAAIQIAQLAVGDGGGSPVTFTDSSVALVHEVHRVSISRAYVSGMKAYVEAILPLDVGGWWVRELAAVDSAGDVVALANVPEVYKPDPDSGASRLIVITMSFTVSVANVVTELVMDPSIVLATRAYADNKAQAAATYAISQLPAQWPDAAKLGGSLPSTFATEAALTSLSATVQQLATDVANSGSMIGAAAPTGFEAGYWGSVAPSGWVFASGRTIGNAASGATERANDDTLALFTLLWNSTPVSTIAIQDSTGAASTKGASAAADWAANKRLFLPDMRGRTGAGKDDMGGTLANRLGITLTGTRAATTSGVITGLTSTTGLCVGMTATGTGIGAAAVISSIDSATQVTLSVNSTATGSGSIRFAVVDGAIMGATGGVQTHTMAITEMPSHNHSVTDPGHLHGLTNAAGSGGNYATGGSGYGYPTSSSTSAATTGISIGSTGGGKAHNNIQPTIVRNVIIKL